MKGIKILFIISVSCLVVSSLYADIYEWTDKNGVKHFTNYSPPDKAGIIMKTIELPYDEAADRVRLEAERQERLELGRLQIAERNAELEQREAEAERRVAEANRQAEETLREAEQYLNEARNDRYDYRSYGYIDYSLGYYPPRYHNRYYYRNKTSSIYFIKPPLIENYKHHRYQKFRFGPDNTYRRNKYHGQKYRDKKTHHRDYRRRSHGGGLHNRHSIRSNNESHTGRRLSGRVRSVSRRN